MSPNTKNKKLIDRGIMPVVILTIVALVSVLLLALTASLTKDARDRQEELMKSENQRLLFPDADAFEPVELTDIESDLPDVKKVDLAKKGGETIGYVLEVSKGAYGGQLPVLTGVNNDGQVVGVQILDNNETAGIGKKVEDQEYRDQFIGLLSSDPADVDTITGATVSSASVNSSVRDALVAYGVLSGTGGLPVKLDSKELIFADGVFEDMDTAEFEDNISAAWTVKDEAGAEIGTLFESTVQGYGGEVPVLTGFDANGEIVGVALGDNNETEGFGKKWENPENLEQFAGQKANESLEIDMIAEVTVTSYAMQSGIENAKTAYLTLSGEAPPVDEPGDDIKLELFPGATFTALDVSSFADDGITEAYKSEDGYVVGVDAKGFGGPLHILVGYDLDGVIKGVLLESHSETPGYGKAAEEAEYRDQYIGQNAADEIAVDQIAGSTTTSNAFVAGVQKTTEVYKVIDTLAELEEAPPVDPPAEDDIKQELFPGAAFTALDVTEVDAKGITEAYKTDDGYVVGAEAQGFGGAMKILVGYDRDGVIKGVLLESHGETPGFGKQAEEAEYRDQYIGKNAADEIEVDQIAGSTVTSKAFVEAVQQTAEVYKIIDTLPELGEQPEEPPVEDDPKLELFPDATFEEVDATPYEEEGVTAIYKTEEGYVIEAVTKGFGGDLNFSVGYKMDGEITGLLVGENSETPGFGKQAEEAEYRDQYKGQNANEEIAVDTIAGSTVTSKAIVEGVQKTADVFKQLSGETPEEPPAEEDPKLELFPDATFEEVDATPYEEEGVTAIYKTEEGYVIEAVTKGFGGDLNFSVGYKLDGEITGLLVGENSETPGFGKQAEEAEYRDQYKGQNANEEIAVDAIAGSTVTSKAIVEGVQKTADVFKQLSGETPGEPPVEEDPKLELFPDATFEEVDATPYEEEGVTAIYKTEEGYVIEAVTKGFGGDLNFSVGYKMDGEITGLLIGENSETPGFGKQAEEAEYRDQYKGQNANEEIAVDAIAGSTVTSKAIAEGVQKTADVFKQLSGETPEEPPVEEPVDKRPLMAQAVKYGARFVEQDVDADLSDKGIRAKFDAYNGAGAPVGSIYEIEVSELPAVELESAVMLLIGFDKEDLVQNVVVKDASDDAKEALTDDYFAPLIGQTFDDVLAGFGTETSDVDEPEIEDLRPLFARALPYAAIFSEREVHDDLAEQGIQKLIDAKNAAGAPLGTLVEVAVDGFAVTHDGEPIVLLVALDIEGTVQNVLVVSHEETESYGGRALDQDHLAKYVGLELSEDIDIDAIGGVTVTSKALNKAVDLARDTMRDTD